MTTLPLDASARSRSRAIAPKHSLAVRQAETARRVQPRRRWDTPDSRPITTVRLYRAGGSASAHVGRLPLVLHLEAGPGAGRGLRHGCQLLRTDAWQEATSA